ncbi:MAG: DUF4294 domain-containing protein [Chitinophagaceae bacterium]
MVRPFKYFPLVFLLVLLAWKPACMQAQVTPVVAGTDTIPPMPSFEERSKKWGPNDTIITPATWINGEMMSSREDGMVWISKLDPKKLEKYKKEWNRLRNAVYVTYPYARVAGATINDMNEKMKTMHSKKERKAYIKTREKELRKQFSDPLTNLSVYQGKVLMKLINRQTGNDCYAIIKEYKGGLNARMYQTVAFFVGGDLKQEYDLEDKTDRQIESFVREIDGNWYGNPNRQ